ncbi:hypothetical protein [Actinoplanes sp. GCM10030250]|uniref:hypothetical protein n=1 Tax=Actinoplanes sp. GCM10030250 TaxID=3273376 RepID=UPI00360A5C5B
MQLLAGVAVAGVVATGATAFTAPGLLRGAGATNAISGGISGSVAVDGATLDNVTITNSTATPGQYEEIQVTVKSVTGTAPIVSGTVTVTVTAGTSTGSDALIGNAVPCLYSGSGGVWNCSDATDEWTAITALKVEVTNGDV